MRTREEYIQQLFNLGNVLDPFEKLALQAFDFQYKANQDYHNYCTQLERTPDQVKRMEDIPFMPAEAYGVRRISCKQQDAVLQFKSSGTSGNNRSVHHVYDPTLYEQSLERGFRIFYGDPQEYAILALLPSYMEQGESSLVYMVDKLMNLSGNTANRFVLHDHQALYESMLRLKESGQKTLLIGVSYALLDFASAYGFEFPELIIMETGGMKGKRKELIREELHEILKKAFGTPAIHSEYGMTELLSQAYAQSKGVFRSVPWMKIMVRDLHDPWQIMPHGRSGLINIIDLACIDTCCFISTEDIGKNNEDGTFEIFGRNDNSSLRGCNLLIDG